MAPLRFRPVQSSAPRRILLGILVIPLVSLIAAPGLAECIDPACCADRFDDDYAGEGVVRLDTNGCPSFLDPTAIKRFNPVDRWSLENSAPTGPIQGSAEGPVVAAFSVDADLLTAGVQVLSSGILEVRGKIQITNTGTGAANAVAYVANLQKKSGRTQRPGATAFSTFSTAVDTGGTGQGRTTACDPATGEAVDVPGALVDRGGRLAVLDASGQRVLGQPEGGIVCVTYKPHNWMDLNVCKGAVTYDFVADFPLDGFQSQVRAGEVLRFEIQGVFENSSYQGNQGTLCTRGDGERIATVGTILTFQVPAEAWATGAVVQVAWSDAIADPTVIDFAEGYVPSGVEGPTSVDATFPLNVLLGPCKKQNASTQLTKTASLQVPAGAPAPYFAELIFENSPDPAGVVVQCGDSGGGPSNVCEGDFVTFTAGSNAEYGDGDHLGYGSDPFRVLGCYIELLHPQGCEFEGLGTNPCGFRIGDQVVPVIYGSSPYTAQFDRGIATDPGDPTGKNGVLNFFPASFPAGAFGSDEYFSTDERSRIVSTGQNNELATETAALTLNALFSDGAVFGPENSRPPCAAAVPGASRKYELGGNIVRLGDLVLQSTGTDWDGRSVRAILEDANACLAGTTSGCGYLALADVLHKINGNFKGGTANNGFLRLPANAVQTGGEPCGATGP